jgi:hypothetical protein
MNDWAHRQEFIFFSFSFVYFFFHCSPVCQQALHAGIADALPFVGLPFSLVSDDPRLGWRERDVADGKRERGNCAPSLLKEPAAAGAARRTESEPDHEQRLAEYSRRA